MSSSAAENCHSNVTYICEICGYIIEDLSNLKVHLKEHTVVNEDENNCLLLVENYLPQQKCNKNSNSLDSGSKVSLLESSEDINAEKENCKLLI